MRAVPKRTRPSVRNKPYQPSVGREFPVEDAETIDAATRRFLAKFVAFVSVAAVGTAGVYGLRPGSYGPVNLVWAVSGRFVGAVLSFYFGAGRKDTG